MDIGLNKIWNFYTCDFGLPCRALGSMANAGCKMHILQWTQSSKSSYTQMHWTSLSLAFQPQASPV